MKLKRALFIFLAIGLLFLSYMNCSGQMGFQLIDGSSSDLSSTGGGGDDPKTLDSKIESLTTEEIHKFCEGASSDHHVQLLIETKIKTSGSNKIEIPEFCYLNFSKEGSLVLDKQEIIIASQISASDEQQIFFINQAKLRGFKKQKISAQWFGAIADGKTDSTLAFQQASEYGRTTDELDFFIPKGSYRVGKQKWIGSLTQEITDKLIAAGLNISDLHESLYLVMANKTARYYTVDNWTGPANVFLPLQPSRSPVIDKIQLAYLKKWQSPLDGAFYKTKNTLTASELVYYIKLYNKNSNFLLADQKALDQYISNNPSVSPDVAARLKQAFDVVVKMDRIIRPSNDEINFHLNQQQWSYFAVGKGSYIPESIVEFSKIVESDIIPSKIKIRGDVDKDSGQLLTKLVANDNLRFGAFDPDSGEIIADEYDAQGERIKLVETIYRASPYTMIHIEGADSAEIFDIELDGNDKNIQIGGKWGDSGIQAEATGMNIYNIKNLLIKNIYVHHHCEDGIGVGFRHLTDADPEYPTLLTNIKSVYNGRQGLSLVGGNSVIIKDSFFGFTGKGNVPGSNPATGIDLEAEGAVLRNVDIINVKVVDNLNLGIGAGSGDSSFITIRNSILVGTNSPALLLMKPGMKVIDSTIVGPLMGLFQNGNYTSTRAIPDGLNEDKTYEDAKGNKKYYTIAVSDVKDPLTKTVVTPANKLTTTIDKPTGGVGKFICPVIYIEKSVDQNGKIKLIKQALSPNPALTSDKYVYCDDFYKKNINLAVSFENVHFIWDKSTAIYANGRAVFSDPNDYTKFDWDPKFQNGVEMYGGVGKSFYLVKTPPSGAHNNGGIVFNNCLFDIKNSYGLQLVKSVDAPLWENTKVLNSTFNISSTAKVNTKTGAATDTSVFDLSGVDMSGNHFNLSSVDGANNCKMVLSIGSNVTIDGVKQPEKSSYRMANCH